MNEINDTTKLAQLKYRATIAIAIPSRLSRRLLVTDKLYKNNVIVHDIVKSVDDTFDAAIITITTPQFVECFGSSYSLFIDPLVDFTKPNVWEASFSLTLNEFIAYAALRGSLYDN